jgi:hypothetical protein
MLVKTEGVIKTDNLLATLGVQDEDKQNKTKHRKLKR